MALSCASLRLISALQGMGPARTRLVSSASEGAVIAAAAADSQAADDQTALLLQEALSKHRDALAKADVRRVTFLSPRDTTAVTGRYVYTGDGGGSACCFFGALGVAAWELRRAVGLVWLRPGWFMTLLVCRFAGLLVCRFSLAVSGSAVLVWSFVD